jgi:hypothetical protein
MRDEYLRGRLDGRAKIDDYYRTAPVIIDAVNSSPDPSREWNQIYEELVAPVTDLVDKGRIGDAADLALAIYGTIKARHNVQ